MKAKDKINTQNNGTPQDQLQKSSPSGTPAFEAAANWASGRLELLEVTANRWQLAFWVMLLCLLVSLFALMGLTPLKTVEPIIIQQDLRTGEVFVKPGEAEHLVKTQQETESDCVRYIVSRETYAMLDEEVRYRQVKYMSAPSVFSLYRTDRDSSNPKSFPAVLGQGGLRTVIVEDIVFLDASDPSLMPEARAKIPPIAKVDFMTVETQGQSVTKQYWVSTLRFEYLGTPDTKEAAWANWDGFTVTDYRVDQRNV